MRPKKLGRSPKAGEITRQYGYNATPTTRRKQIAGAERHGLSYAAYLTMLVDKEDLILFGDNDE